MRRVIVLVLLVSLVPSVGAVAPNDDLASATPIAVPSTTSGSNADATVEMDEPDPCGVMTKTVWFTITVSETTPLRLDTFTSDFDTVLAVYEGTSYGALQLLACSDDAADTLQSHVAFSAVAGVTYSIQLGGYWDDTGTFALAVDVAALLPNDNFASATPAHVGFHDVVETYDATLELGEPSCTWTFGASVWYTLDVQSTPVHVATAGSNFDTVLAAYQGDTLSELSRVACDDDGGPQFTSHIILYPSDLPYRIQVGGYGSATGQLVFDVIPPLENDALPEPIPSLPFEAVVDTTYATTEYTHLSPCGEIGRSVWWNYTATEPGFLVASTAGSEFDTILNAYVAGDAGLPCSDDGFGTSASTVVVPVVPGMTVLFEAGGYGETAGILRFRLESGLTAPPGGSTGKVAAPIVAELSQSGILS